MLIYDNVEKTISLLDKAIVRHEQTPEDLLVRDGLIRRFKMNYEATHKACKRYLEETEASSETINNLSFQDLIRTGAEHGLLANSWEEWKEYREIRNKTTHRYSEDMIAEMMPGIKKFLSESRYFLEQLKKREG